MPSLTPDARRMIKASSRRVIDAASEAFANGAIDEASWYGRVTRALASAYLEDDNDPRWQSGFDGDEESWREARELVLLAVDRDGSFLDVGCANGHLMESLAAWALERGRRLTMYGLELDPGLAGLARRRLPEWADRIYDGNAIDWAPPMRFTYVRTGLEYVPAGRGPFLVTRLVRDVVQPGGRLIAGPVHLPELADTVAAFEAAGFVSPSVREATDRRGKTRCVVYVER